MFWEHQKTVRSWGGGFWWCDRGLAVWPWNGDLILNIAFLCDNLKNTDNHSTSFRKIKLNNDSAYRLSWTLRQEFQ